MADYIIQGKKGNGKSLIAVNRIRDALVERNTVATNLDLYLEHMLPPSTRDILVYRLPDKPTADDLRVLGRGAPKGRVDESKYGSIVVDECATILNARTFNDKGRSEFLDYYVHSRKLAWNTYFICQNVVQIDKQVRESLADLIVSCRRLDRIRIPVVGPLSKMLLGFEIRPPKTHMATVRYGSGNEAILSDRWIYTGTDLYKAYDTEQVFRNEYDAGIYCYLTPWHLSVVLAPDKKFVGPLRPGRMDWVVKSGRVSAKNKATSVMKYIGLVLMVGLFIGFFGGRYYSARHLAQVAPASGGKLAASASGKKFSESLKAVGYFRTGSQLFVSLSDGRTVAARSFVTSGDGFEAEVDSGVWVKGGQ